MHRIDDLIRTRKLSPDQRLPSERQLERQWRYGRTTLNRAVACLIAQGHLRRVGYKLYPSGLETGDGKSADDATASAAPPPIHIVQPPYSDSISQGVIEAAHDVAQSRNTHTIPVISRSAAEQCRQLAGLLRNGTNGFVLWPNPDAPVESLLKQFTARGVPFVLCDLDLGPFNFVGVDNEQGMRLAVEHLYALGHRRIVYVTQPLRIVSLRRRCDGYVQACQSFGLTKASRAIVEIPSVFALDIESVFKRIRADFPDATAIAFSNDWAAIHFMKLAHDAGIDIPGELSIIGFDGIDAANITTPALTSVAQNFHHTGVLATELLFHLMEKVRTGHPGESPIRVRVEPRLVVRRSTARRP